ncbi:Rieske (2Fe-2S) protein [Pseudonocardia sp. K10HN5]|uniref:Cytochrome bc1 complex Rieske iron-sulfur subunit n=2 Tax=Pseudonocardia acidicola TaxID=2724939 RepID=A0ABX1SFQ6_9PSEU|nr:Rieske (2Fe-2S) protein [Pseudonocardia acidicola]NMI00387.1 Rieske (2Fe-2S) protein [Pseudonocardia acidicola]
MVTDDAGTTGPLTTTEAIPVGGGVIFPERGVVITQPAPGVFLAFSTTCTHQGCSVRAVAAGTINCFCHGSRFRITDGSVAGGPAPAPLPRHPITVTGGSIHLG